ncbi:dihydrodipicolinate synthase family protein [Pseudarthrobacter phenanthrenivorans]|uniref:Dihydrodipicolinate synthase family protein n=1 Tax=Pseudarthrobacter phenanthrenivorans TaxID=361575 RepID=A0A3B0FJU2_PSEPS|nr:dihydrodipicolinate synthase family protein [Pseudarthrobacter phenanthrenivorans]RKO19968.1 dihydrodipicolinate synthase family protein [Pseudarthrobacter phenanthrenivorans]
MIDIKGVVPVAPTAFTDEEELDLQSQRRIVDYLVDAGSDAMCILANFSEQFSLTDEERESVISATMSQVDNRIPVCVTTSHYSARIAAARSRRAQEQGASMVMLMPPFAGSSMKVNEAGVVDYFKRVADNLDIPIMVQDAPMSPTPLSVQLLARLAKEIPQVKYAKIEVAGAAEKIRNVIQAAGDALPGPFDGEESVTLIPDLEAGAQGTMSSAMIPDKLGQIVHKFLAGERASAEEIWEDMLPLIQFENRQCGLSATKILMEEGTIIRSAKTRSPMSEVHPETRQQLLALAKRKDAFILRWS